MGVAFTAGRSISSNEPTCPLHPAPCTLPSAPCTLLPASCPLPPTSYTLPPASCTLPHAPCPLLPAPCLLHPPPLPPASCTLSSAPCLLYPPLCPLHPNPHAPCPLPPTSCLLPLALCTLHPTTLENGEKKLRLILARDLPSDPLPGRNWIAPSPLPPHPLAAHPPMPQPLTGSLINLSATSKNPRAAAASGGECYRGGPSEEAIEAPFATETASASREHLQEEEEVSLS
ncbi:uncharacterized protein LOC134786006 [Penaeus indicus]|uniref:uncharacterized protein LOC134786006 n=1 Tax=Penaeus indicus TaxID=29960 RepID=UPI00300CD0F5